MRKSRHSRLPDELKFTRDGYIDDGFVIDDDLSEYTSGREYFDLDSEPIQQDIISRLTDAGIDKKLAKRSVKRAFSQTGTVLVQDYIGSKPNEESWKLGVPASTIKRIEPELKRIRKEIKDETPNILKILESNITHEDKKRCIILFYQLNNIEPYTVEQANKIEEINNIIRKGEAYTKEQIEQLDAAEAYLKSKALPGNNLKNQILTMNAPDNVKIIVYGQYLEMLEHEPGSQVYNSIREEIEWSLRLPHNNQKSDNLANLSKEELTKYYTDFMNKVDKKLYGMENIKLQMLHILNSRRNGNKACGRNIAIVGPPGVGKTSIAKALAEALNQPYEKISVGGLEDASILKGSDKVWNSSSPSIVLQILARTRSSKSIIIFDEVDKLGVSQKGKEVQYALLHISDYSHNHEFRDSYLNKYPHDLSNVTFIYIMNKTEGIDEALLSRMDIIYTEDYDRDDKIIIAQKYVLPTALKEVGLKENDAVITNEALVKLIKVVEHDPGIREIEKVIKSLVDKINMYNSIISKNGTIKLPYHIPNFKLPLKIDTKLMIELTKDKINW